MKWLGKTIMGGALLLTGGCAAASGFLADVEVLKSTTDSLGFAISDDQASMALSVLKAGGAIFAILGGLITIWQFFFAQKPPSEADISRIFAGMEGVEFVSGRDTLTREQLHNRPADILLARFQAVPFDDCAGHLEGVLNWAAPRKTETTRDVHVRLISAGGGFGKTRLALEAIEKLKKQDWVAGFLPRAATDSARFVPVVKKLLSLGRPAGYFIVLDYAELRPRRVEELVVGLSQLANQKGKPVRVLMLARSDGWWGEVCASPEGAKICETDAFRLFDRASLSSAAKPLLFEACAKSFASELTRNAVTVATQSPAPPADLTTNEFYDRHLTIAMAAFLALRGADRTDGKFNLFDALLDEEKRNWQRATKKTGDEAQADERAENIARGASQITLIQGAGEDTILSLRAIDPSRQNDPPLEHRAAATSLMRIYPGVPADKAPGAGPIEPDILGEAAIARLAETNGGLALIRTTLLRDLQTNDCGELSNILAVVIRMASHPEERAKLSAEAIIGDWTQQIVPALSLDLLSKFEDVMGLQTLALADFALAIANRRFELSPEGETEEQKKSRAEALAWQSIRLSNLGCRQEALVASKEAVEIGRQLAKERPDAFLPDLASSLNNLSTRFSKLGCRQEALVASEEAVEIYRALAKARPDAFLPDLASSLNNLGTRFFYLGRWREALFASEEAVEIRRQLAKARPDTFLPDLASSLNNLGTYLSNLGRREEALSASQEAVEIIRALAKEWPDAFLPDLALSLNNLSGELSYHGRREEALAASKDAVEITRALAKEWPDAFLPDLARSLHNAGMAFSDLGRRKEAFAAAQEAVAIRRQLAKARPEAFLPDLATSLSALGYCLMALEGIEDAAAASEESLNALEPYYRSNPDAYGGLWSTTKSDLQAALLASGLAEAEVDARMRRWK